MELYEAVSRRMGIPEVVIRGSMGYMKQSRIFMVTFLGVLDPVQRILSTPQVYMCSLVEVQKLPLCILVFLSTLLSSNMDVSSIANTSFVLLNSRMFTLGCKDMHYKFCFLVGMYVYVSTTFYVVRMYHSRIYRT